LLLLSNIIAALPDIVKWPPKLVKKKPFMVLEMDEISQKGIYTVWNG
jgi:hypothetical protein